MLRGFTPPFTRGRTRRPAPWSTTLVVPAAPDTPSTPSPADTATAYYTRLSWVSARATNVDVYLGTTNPPTTIVAPKIQATSYVPTLLPSTTYYWKIAAFNAGGSATGPVWSFTTPAATDVLITLAGALVTRARYGLTIHDVLGAAPNTASVTFDTTAPSAGEAVTIGLGTLDDDALIFSGEIQAIDQTYVDTPDGSPLWPLTLIDHTFRLNRRRPFGTWVSVSATTIGRYLVATFAPGFTSSGIPDGLPAVSINFDGQADFMTCMRALATAISDDTHVGKTKVDYAKDVQLFLVDADAVAPDPIDIDHPTLNDPSPLVFSVDHSQLRTRVYGKGHGETIPCDVAVGETILPIADAVMYQTAGGLAIVSTTADGAQTTVITYAGVQLGGGGSLVGPGQAPSVAPSPSLVIGTGLGAGIYQYAYTDVTAAGESLPSPLGTITTGVLAAPSSAPTPVIAVGTGLGTGTYQYAYTDVTAAGETLPSPLGTVAIGTLAASPSSVLSCYYTLETDAGTDPFASGDLERKWAFTYTTAGGETIPSPLIPPFSPYLYPLVTSAAGAYGHLVNIPLGPTGVTGRKIYRTVSGGSQLKLVGAIADNVTTTFDDRIFDGALGANAPSTNTASLGNQAAVSAIAVGPSGTTSRKVYRTAVGGSQLKLLTTIADNTTTSYTDSTADGSLGANVPTVGTALVQQVSVSGIASGASPTTSRKVYRTAVGGSQLKLLTTIGDNTTTIYADSTPDASLGANVPTGDTSGLTQPTGQVIAGQTSLLTASAAPFSANGGWVILSGGQTVRYTGVSTNTLTGIPASGAGSITTTVLYGSQVLPAPALTGVNHNNGVALAMAKGAAVHIWVQRDDLDAQAALGLLELDDDGNPTDGIREYTITDDRRTEASLIALCDADLALFSRPIVSASYYTRDIKTKAGRTVSIDLVSGTFDPATFDHDTFDVAYGFGEAGDFVIQDVTLTFDGPRLYPLRQVKASSVAFTLADLLRRVPVS